MSASFELSKSQIDRLGDRLRKGNISADDLQLLDRYRRSFGAAYENVVGQIRDRLELEPTGRPAKSTTSIIDKLQRESIRLTQMQDIGGCRLTVPDLEAQDEVIPRFQESFANTTVIDRRHSPSHGYRAVHVVINEAGKLIEVQVRTLLQHLWAESSEKASDLVDKEIKYGLGPSEIAKPLSQLSHKIRMIELNERLLLGLLRDIAKLKLLRNAGRLSNEVIEEVALLDRKAKSLQRSIVDDRQRFLVILKELNDGMQGIR